MNSMSVHDIRCVASFGASTAQGAGDDQKAGFIERLGDLLNITSLNYGVGGNTTRDMLERLDGLTFPDHCLLVVTLGINDVPRMGDESPKRVPLEEHGKNVAAILKKLNQKVASLQYLSQFPVDYPARNLDAALCVSYVDRGLTEAKKQGVATLVQVPHLKKLDRWQDLLAADGLHFNADGHAFMAEILFEYISR